MNAHSVDSLQLFFDPLLAFISVLPFAQGAQGALIVEKTISHRTSVLIS